MNMETMLAATDKPIPSQLRVLIVGGGVSGLISLTVLKRYGFNVHCVEAGASVGGQWNKSYDGVTLNNSNAEYCLPGRPYPKGTPEYPTKQQVLAYWNSLVEDFNMESHIRLNTCVTSMRKTEDSKWICTLHQEDGSEVEETYDKVVLATGYIGHSECRNDNVSLPGRETFPGKIAHISQLPSNWMPRPRSTVTVIGSGASAAGLSSVYATQGYDVKVEQVYRRQNWFIPRYIFGVIPYHELMFSRLSSIMIASWFHESRLERFVQSPGMKWFVNLFWRFLELVFIVSVFAPRKMWPKGRLQSTLTLHGTFVAPNGYFQGMRQGKIDTHLATVDQLTEDGEMMLSNGDKFHTDQIILATGYTPSLGSFIEDESAQKVLRDPRFQLYKHMIHPDIPNVGFVGFAQGFVSCPTEYVQACWLSEYFCGHIKTPVREVMMETSRRIYNLKKKLCPTEHYPGVVTSGGHHQYLDELLVSLGVDPRRKSNMLTYLLEKTTSGDYATVVEEAQAARLKRQPLLF